MGKGKEKVEYAATRESWCGNTGLDSADTDSSRTPRGRTKMDSLAIQRVKEDLAFNKLGQPVGEAAIAMQSYIGVVVREKVKITYKTWKQVPGDVKDLIWDSVNLLYNVDAKWKKGCLRSANTKWRQYKTHLTQTFILSKLDKPEELYEPPAGHGIPKDVWSEFVISRMSGDFIKLSEQQKERRKQHVYPHRLSRKGYARFASEIAAELCDDDDINRAIMWKKGRANKAGDFEGEDLTQRVMKIDDYIQQKRDGVLRIEGTKEDILTKALETKEYDGRVRGIGGHVTPTLYFNAGRTFGVPTEVSNDHERRLVEANKIISEQGARLQRLETMMYNMGACGVLMEDKGSCSVKNQVNQAKMEVNDYEDVQILSKADALQGKSAALTLESNTNIVAYDTIICVDPQKLIHGVPLPKNCYRVSIDVVVEKTAPLPFPIANECEVVGDALGTHVAWPQHLIVEQDKKPRKKDLAPPKEKHVVSPGVPMSLHMMYCYSNHALGEGRFISVRLDREVFDDDCVVLLHYEDIDGLYHVGPISGNCVIAYIWCLYKKMLGDNKEGKFRFVNPHRISVMGETPDDKKSKLERLNQRASALADRLSGASVDQLVLAPCNIGYHWILTVIQPYKDVIYVLDSLSHRIRDDDWKYVVEMALKLFNSDKGRKGRKNAMWVVIQGPRQPDAKQCALYVMRYMRQIIQEVENIENVSLRSIFSKGEYSLEEIKEVLSELTESIQEHVYE